MATGDGALTSTASVMFTDLVASTELRARIGEDAADEIRRHHDAAVGAAIEANNGRVVKHLGDGLMAVFEAAADAVAAAVACQQGVATLSGVAEPVTIRVGISVGDVSFEGDDCFGTAVNEAARLCGVAQGSQILVADLVRALARGRGGFTFESFGALDLKGLPEPVQTCSVGWDPLPRLIDDRVPFPPALMPGSAGGYVGREDIRATLTDIWDQTKVDGPQVVLLVGEPGIGKTRTACEIAREATDSGAVVLFGRCDAELAMPYQPFVEALDWQTRHAPDLPLGRVAGDLTRLVPDLEMRCPGLAPPVTSDPRTEEHRLFEAVASWLESTARETGLVLVLDDLHWATKPTLLMLMHAARHVVGLEGVRLLVVGTYRDTDVDRTHPLSVVLGDLLRIERVRRMPVDALEVGEVLELVEQAAGHPLDEVTRQVAARAHAETEGNPFFVGEVLRHLIESGAVRFVDGRWVVPHPDQIDVPEGVRDVIGQRLSRLSEQANEVLRAASVLGREFDLELVGALLEVADAALLDAIDDAERAHLVEEIGADRYRFSHALVRTSLYDELSASRRRRMHRRITDLYRERTPPDLAALAHHSVEAGPRDGNLSDAIGFVLAAADQSREARALADAEALYRKALDLLEEDEASPLDRRALLARCGIAEILRDQGDPTFAQAFIDVGADAMQVGLDEIVVRAALENTRGLVSIVGRSHPARIAQLDTAVARLPVDPRSDGEIATRARLEAQLASELMFDVDRRDEIPALIDHAVALAETIDDDLTTALVLGVTYFASLSPKRWADDLGRVARSVEAADRCGDPQLRTLNRINLSWSRLAVGDVEGARVIVDGALAIALAETGPLTQWVARAMTCQYHLLAGDINRAIAENDVAFALGVQLGAPDAENWWAAFLCLAFWYRDRSFGDPDLIGAMADQFPAAAWRGGHAAGLAMYGRTEEARAVIEQYGLDDPDAQSRDGLWFMSCFSRAVAVFLVDDASAARRLLAAVDPYADHFAHYFIALNGPMRYIRHYLRCVAGDLDGAIADLRWSLEWAAEKELTPVRVTYQFGLTDVLIRRGTAADLDEAAALLAAAVPVAERFGMPGWLAYGEQLRAQLGP